MSHGITTIVYPVKDATQATALYNALLGVEPYVANPYYVGYKVGGQDIGLDPNGHSTGLTGPLAYHHVDDVAASLQALLDAGAQLVQPVKDVGGGKQIATVKDADGNLIGIIQHS